MKRALVALVASAALGAWAQNEPPFTTQCISKNETGFNWEKTWWASKNYRAGTIYMAKKVDHSDKAFNGKDALNTPHYCKGIEDSVYDLGFLDNGDKAREACYTIKEHGSTESLFFAAEKCYERYDKLGKLKEVQCKQMHFAPDGFFIRLPSHQSINLDPYPDKAYKDSLVISVGTCARIN